MKLITRDTDYAIRAVCFIAKKKGRIVSVPELVKRLKIPGPFLRKLLQILNKEGILLSQKGLGGGFLLARPAKRIFLMDLIKVFQGGLRVNECFLKRVPCPNTETCILRKKIVNIENHVIHDISSITVASLLKGA